MDTFDREQEKDRRWLLLLGAAAGTAALGFVPSAAWLAVPDGDASSLLFASAAKQVLTGMLLFAVPALWARLAHRTSIWSLIGLCAVAYGVGYFVSKDSVQALYTLLLCALPGVGLYALQRLGLNNFRTVLYHSAIVLIALFGYVCLPDLIANGDAYLPFRALIGAGERVVRETLDLLGTTEGAALYSDYATFLDLLSAYRLNAESFGVPLLMIPAMTAGLSNVLLSHLMNRGGEVKLNKLPPFAQWRCERVFVIAASVFAVLTFFLQYTEWNGTAALAGVGSMLWRMPCGLAGLCAMRALSIRVKKGWLFVIVCCASATMPLMALPLFAVIGMLASLRNRTNVGEDGTQL